MTIKKTTKRVNPALLTAALAVPEDNVSVPTTQYKPGSQSAIVSALRIGDCWMTCEQVMPNTPLADVPVLSNSMKSAMRNRVQSILTRVKADFDYEFTTDTADLMSVGGKFFVLCIVTRTA